MKPYELRNIIKSKRRFSQSISPMIKKANTLSAPSRNITLDDNILTVIDQQYFGRAFLIGSEGIYTIKLGAFHDLNKGVLEEAAMFCTIPTKAAYDQQITAIFDIPEASARFMDAVILKATRPFSVTLIEGSPILERHGRQWGIPLKYNSVRSGDVMILDRTRLRENVPDKYRIYFDVLKIQVKVTFK